MRVRLESFLKGVVLFTIYLVTAVVGLHIDAVSGFATLVWLPTGISLAWLVLFGLRFWPAVFLGALAANMAVGAPPVVALSIAIGNAAEAVIGAYALCSIVRFRPQLDRLRDVVGLILWAAVVSTLISATVGVTSLYAGSLVSRASFLRTWTTWWVGDMISNLIVAPFLFVWSYQARIRLNGSQIVELVSILFVLTGISVVVFGGLLGIGVMPSPITYLVFPPLIWVSLRFSPREAITAVGMLAVIAVASTAQGFGPFVGLTLSESLLYLQSFLAVIAVTTMLLSAAVSERRFMEKKKDEFVSVASHELKTPITSIKVFAQTLQRRFEKSGDKQSSLNLARMNKQIDKLSRLVRELLDVAKIQEGKMVVHKERFMVQGLIDEVMEELSKTTPHPIVVSGNVNVEVMADRDRLAQVLTNLLSNAIKYSPATKKITLRVEKHTHSVIISVRDFGKGVTKEEHTQIFKRFYQGRKQGQSSNAGLGLGLYICKEIVKHHGGSIWVESPVVTDGKVEKGSIFYVRLPA